MAITNGLIVETHGEYEIHEVRHYTRAPYTRTPYTTTWDVHHNGTLAEHASLEAARKYVAKCAGPIEVEPGVMLYNYVALPYWAGGVWHASLDEARAEVELAPTRLEVLTEWCDERFACGDPTMIAKDLLRRLDLDGDVVVRGGGS